MFAVACLNSIIIVHWLTDVILNYSAEMWECCSLPLSCSHTSTATSHWGILSWSNRMNKHIWHMNNFGYKCPAHTQSRVYCHSISEV